MLDDVRGPMDRLQIGRHVTRPGHEAVRPRRHVGSPGRRRRAPAG